MRDPRKVTVRGVEYWRSAKEMARKDKKLPNWHPDWVDPASELLKIGIALRSLALHSKDYTVNIGTVDAELLNAAAQTIELLNKRVTAAEAAVDTLTRQEILLRNEIKRLRKALETISDENDLAPSSACKIARQVLADRK